MRYEVRGPQDRLTKAVVRQAVHSLLHPRISGPFSAIGLENGTLFEGGDYAQYL